MVQDCYLVHALTELAGATFMIFTRTADGAQKLALLLRNLSFGAIPIYGKMSQDKRIGALNKFKAGQCSILVATGQPNLYRPPLILRHAITNLRGLEGQRLDPFLSLGTCLPTPTSPTPLLLLPWLVFKDANAHAFSTLGWTSQTQLHPHA